MVAISILPWISSQEERRDAAEYGFISSWCIPRDADAGKKKKFQKKKIVYIHTGCIVVVSIGSRDVGSQRGRLDPDGADDDNVTSEYE